MYITVKVIEGRFQSASTRALRLRLLLCVKLGTDAVLLLLARLLALLLHLRLELARLRLLNKRALTLLLRLHLVDRLHEDALVLELVTLRAHVKLVVEVFVDLLRV